MKSFRALLLEAVKHFATSGYASEGDLQHWIMRLHMALDQELIGDADTKVFVSQMLESVYRRDVRHLGVKKRVPGIERFTLSMIEPRLRAELDRRIFASVDLIKLNRRAAKEKTLQRFAGWVSSVPTLGSADTDHRAIAKEIGKPAAQVKYEARRVAIDQGHKLNAAVAHIVAEQNGAIAAIWNDRGEHDGSYNARPIHLARSGKLFLIRNSWAIEQGLVKRGGPYTDEIEQVAQLPFCSCYYTYISTLRGLPEEKLTAKGRAQIGGLTLV